MTERQLGRVVITGLALSVVVLAVDQGAWLAWAFLAAPNDFGKSFVPYLVSFLASWPAGASYCFCRANGSPRSCSGTTSPT